MEGHIAQDALPEQIQGLGFEALQIQRIEDSKHIFSHVEWHMIAYWVLVAPVRDREAETSGIQLIEREERRSRYAIPSAFSAYLSYL